MTAPHAGAKPQDEPIDKDGAAAYFTRFPVRKLAEKIGAEGASASLSYSAGAYVCNDLYYRLLSRFEGSGTRAVFIHIPSKTVVFLLLQSECRSVSQEPQA